jgi:thiol-disulfide isomerase/thioredoxin
MRAAGIGKGFRIALAVFFIVALVVVTDGLAQDKSEVAPVKTHSLSFHGNIPSFAGATGWLNSPPLTPAALRGKVVLIDIWTFTCVNWLRTLPYVRAWADRYRDQGLVVIGVSDPEFPFEHDVDNVRNAAKAMRVSYPIAIDNDFVIWRALMNQYWPAVYLVDAQGRIRFRHFGEGAYEETEKAIRELLVEAGHKDLGEKLATPTPQGPEVAADYATLQSPESYVGAERAEGFASTESPVVDARHTYSLPTRLGLNHWGLAGDWTVKIGSAVSNGAGARIVYKFHARDANLVMGAAARGGSVRYRVLIDGKPPGAAHGGDVDEAGRGTLAEPRMYQLIRQPGSIADRQIEIEFLDPGAEAFCFTFG